MSKGLPTLRLVAWASWRGPSGVVCLVVTPYGPRSKHTTPDGVETRHMARLSKHTTPDGPRHEAHATRRSVGRPLHKSIKYSVLAVSVI